MVFPIYKYTYTYKNMTIELFTNKNTQPPCNDGYMYIDGSCTHDTTLTNSRTNVGIKHRKTAVHPKGAVSISTSTLNACATTTNT